MKRLNVIGLDTRHGYRTVELLEGDISTLDFAVDLLVVSAFRGGYEPIPGTVLGTLMSQHGIDVDALSHSAELDLRIPLGVWISAELSSGPMDRLMCVEMKGTGLAPSTIFENVFAALALAEAKNIPVQRIAMPLLGTGNQRMNAAEIVALLVPRTRSYLERAYSGESIYFVEIDGSKAKLISDAMDAHLGRSHVALPQEQLVGFLREDVRNRLLQAKALFESSASRLFNEWIDLLQAPLVRSSEFGVAARKLVELILTQFEVPNQVLYKRIRYLEERGDIAPWICGYMHLLRHFGNESAHESMAAGGRRPSVISPADMTAGLFCVQRLLEFWLAERKSVNEQRTSFG
jgi:Domain of unknown function (DUF4145)